MTEFAKRLKEAMEGAKISQTDLASKIGCSKASISQYLSGNNVPTKNRAALIADALDVPFEYLAGKFDELDEGKKLNNLPVKMVAKLMGVSDQFVRVGIQQGVLPFGFAVKVSGDRYTYYINPIKFTEYTGIEIK